MTNLACVKNSYEAVVWFRKAAEQGIARAQYNLGLCYDYGDGVRQSTATAISWYRKAAEHGNADAQFTLGSCYDSGNGVTRNRCYAINWYTKAAAQGHAYAQYALSMGYESGIGVEKNIYQERASTNIIDQFYPNDYIIFFEIFWLRYLHDIYKQSLQYWTESLKFIANKIRNPEMHSRRNLIAKEELQKATIICVEIIDCVRKAGI